MPHKTTPTYSLSAAVILVLSTIRAGHAGDLERLQGTWKIVEDKIDGVKGPSPIKSGSLVVEDDRFTLTEVHISEGSITFDFRQTPHVLERTFLSSDGQVKTSQAIFELGQDTYREFGTPNGELAKAFPPDEKQRGSLRVWERVRRPSAGEAKSKGGLNGTWKTVEWTVGGRRMDDSMFAGIRMIIENGRYVQRSESVKKGIVRLDPSKTPMEIDCELDYPVPYKGVVSRGIYRFDGDTLVFVMGVTGDVRPTVFDYVQGSAAHRMKLAR